MVYENFTHENLLHMHNKLHYLDTRETFPQQKSNPSKPVIILLRENSLLYGNNSFIPT